MIISTLYLDDESWDWFVEDKLETLEPTFEAITVGDETAFFRGKTEVAPDTAEAAIDGREAEDDELQTGCDVTEVDGKVFDSESEAEFITESDGGLRNLAEPMIDGGATSPMLKLPKLFLTNKLLRVDKELPGSLSSFMAAIKTDWSITSMMDLNWYIKTEEQLRRWCTEGSVTRCIRQYSEHWGKELLSQQIPGSTDGDTNVSMIR